MLLFEFDDPIDRVTIDIPLFIRILELTREEIQSDADLHHMVDKIIKLSKQTAYPLDMKHYDAIEDVIKHSLGDDDEINEDPVWSSWIADLEYYEFKDGTTGVLMGTNGGSEYFINGVGPQEYENWMKAPSKGKHWWEAIKYIYT